MYKTAIKMAMVYMYGAKCWAVRKKQERKLHTSEMNMLRWARGKTRLDHVRNVHIWKEAHMYTMAEFLREKRLRWYGNVQRRDKDETTRKILQMTVDGKRNRGSLKLRWRDLVKEDTDRNQMPTEMEEDRKPWHVMIRAGTLLSGLQSKKFQKSELTIEVGGGSRSHLEYSFFGKSSQNSPKPVLIFWSSIPCVFCLYIHLHIVKSCYSL